MLFAVECFYFGDDFRNRTAAVRAPEEGGDGAK
jgi:hypothetical protein